MKKILVMGASVVMFFATATPAFATGPCGYFPWPVCPTTTPEPTTNTNTISFQGNNLYVHANSGKNLEVGAVGTGVIAGSAFGSVYNGGGLSQGITTGDASAFGQQIVQLSPTGCTDCQTTKNTVNFDNNYLRVGANSGKNAIVGGVVTGTYHAFTGGVSNTGGVAQGITTGGAGATGNQWVITGVTTSTAAN